MHILSFNIRGHNYSFSVNIDKEDHMTLNVKGTMKGLRMLKIEPGAEVTGIRIARVLKSLIELHNIGYRGSYLSDGLNIREVIEK